MGGLRGALDLVRREPERDGHHGGIELRGPVAVELANPQAVALLDGRGGRVEEQRWLACPRGIPGPVPDEHHRGATLGEGADDARPAIRDELHRPGDDAGAAKAGFARGRRGHVARVLVRAEPREVQLQHRPPYALQRGCGE